MSHEITAKPTPRIEPLFYFDRQCEEAIELYKRAFDAKVTYFQRYSDVYKDASAKDLPLKYDAKTDSELIYHAQIRIGSQRLLLCDNLFNDLPRGHSASFVVMFNHIDEVTTVYDVLAEGATIMSPPGGDPGGPIVDKFGIHWDLIVYHD